MMVAITMAIQTFGARICRPFAYEARHLNFAECDFDVVLSRVREWSETKRSTGSRSIEAALRRS